MDIEKIIADMELASNKYSLAKDMGIGVNAAKEQMKNIGFNYFDRLLEIAKKSKSAQEQISMLTLALEDSDRELAELKAKAKTAKPKKPAAEKE